jgi:hypothetical protein
MMTSQSYTTLVEQTTALRVARAEAEAYGSMAADATDYLRWLVRKRGPSHIINSQTRKIEQAVARAFSAAELVLMLRGEAAQLDGSLR